MKTKPILRSFPLAAAIAALLSAQSASAQQNGTWLGNSGNWNDSAIWVDGIIADGADFTANFTGVNIPGARTITLTAPQTIGNITFTDATASSHDLTIAGNILTMDVTTGSPVISVTQSDRLLSISSEITGNDGLTKSGPGVLSLTNATNTYTGVTSILNGRLAASSLGALGSTSGITIGGASAATISSGITGLTITAPITTANSGVSSTLAFGVNASSTGSFTLNGAIGGAGNVIYTTVGTSNNNLQTINLGVAGDYTGTTTITSGTTANSMFVKAGVNDALPTTTVLTINGGNGSGGGRASAYDLNGFNQTLAGLTNTTGLSLRAQRVINTNADTLSTLTVNNAADYPYSGTIGGNTNLGVGANNLALTKNGAGTLTLGVIGGTTANNHDYTGPTNILGGTLRLATTAVITASSGITINGSTAKLLQTSETAIAPTVTLTQGTLSGNGTVNTVNVGNATGGIVSNNNGVAGAALTIGTLTFDGTATVNTFGNASAPILTTSLATNAAGTVTINPSAASWAAGTYELISYGGGSISGGGFAQFALGTVSGASVRQGAVLGDSGSAITLTVGPDDAPYWAGDGDGKWNLSAPDNWKLTSNNGATTFLATDNVVFNDSATGDGPILVDIDPANVSPSNTTFDNSTKDYVLNSSGNSGIATGGLTKNGTGTLTLNTANTYTGDTVINAGTLSLGGGGPTGSLSPSSSITVASGATFAVNQSDTVTQGIDFGVISGAGGFAQLGAGTTVLNLINGFTGPISIANGFLAIGPDGRLGSGTYAGNIDIASAASVFEHGGTLNQTLSGIISGEGSLLKSGSNTLTLSGANTYEGATTVSQGILSITNVNALQNTSGITLGGALPATLSTATTGITISAPITTANTGVNSTIAFATSVSATQGSINLNGAIGGAGNVIFSSPNVGASTGQTQFINLGATGTWAGNTTLTTGNSQVAPRLVNTSGAANVLPVTTVLRMTGGTGNGTGRGLTFDLNGQNQELAGLQNTLAVDRDQRVTSVNPATLTINNSDDYAFGGTIGSGDDDGSGKIIGAISLTKTGMAKFTLTGSHDFTGNTTVSQGILSLSADNVSNNASTVTIAPTATLELNFAGTDTVDKLFIGATQQPAGVYGALLSGAQFEISQITGTGTLTVTSSPVAGGYAAWALANAGGEGPEMDFDQDGVSNGVEFFINAPAGFTANPQLNASNTISWTNGGNIPASAYGTQFVVQTSSNLSTWTNVLAGDLTTNTDGPGGSLTYTLTGGSPRFVRLSVTPN